jgi:HK97 family phage major capsid protein
MAKKLTERQIQRLLGKKLKRAFTVERGELVFDDETQTIRNISFSSDAPIEHYFGRLILNHAPACIRLERLRAGGPFLCDHDRTKLAGVHERVETDGHRMRGDVRFSKNTVLGRETYADIRDGIRPNTSIGLIVHELHLVREDEDGPVYQSDDWEPLEDSSVTIPADISVGVGRAMDDDDEAAVQDEAERRSEQCSCDGAGCDVCNPAAVEEDDEAERSQLSGGDLAAQPPTTEARATMERDEELQRLGEMFGEEELARDFIADETKTVKEFRVAVKAKRAAAQAQTQTPTEDPAAAAARQGGGNVQLARTSSRVQLKAFRGEDGARQAHRFGNFIAAALHRHDASIQFCRENGIEVRRAHSESDNETGGFLVPTEFENVMIDLRLAYGVFRPNANVVPMSGGRKERPRRKGGLTAYPIGARGTNRRLTESRQGWDLVGLDPKKWGVLAKYEEELSEDWFISTGDNFASEAAFAFAQTEDECGFIGDGSSTYHGITGVIPKLTGLHATVANIAGLQVASGNAWSEIVKEDILGVVGRLPSFARQSGQVKWYCTNEFWATVLCRIALSLGGVPMAEIQGEIRPVFLGKPVETVEVMPHTEANSQVCLLYGNLAQAAMFGDRRGVTVKMTDSNDTDFEEDLMAYKATERFDINVHDVGNASATANLRKAGPVVGLITAAA